MGGFECATHRRADRRRLDLITMTEHDRYAADDYALLHRAGLRTVRDGLRWHLIEKRPGHYDWSSFRPMLRAANSAGVQVIWDLCHYGWPDDLDIWSPGFIDRFANFCGSAARIVRNEGDAVPFYCPVNEISFWAWAGGDMARINPLCRRQGAELKRQLVRAALAGTDAVRDVDPRARFVYAEPGIHVVGYGDVADEAENYRRSQFEAADMISGRLWPELGGAPDFLDIVGVNYYPDNQWFLGGGTVPMGHHAYRPLRELLVETANRYGRPMLITETGAEGTARPAWLHYVMDEVRAAISEGAPVQGICLYPILDYPGWDNERVCDVGLFSACSDDGVRSVYRPLANELRRQQAVMHEPEYAQ